MSSTRIIGSGATRTVSFGVSQSLRLGHSVGCVLTIWIARLLISERVMQKIIVDHCIYPDEVRSAVERVEGLDFSWLYEPERGRPNPYVIVRAKIRGEDVLIVLYPTDDPMDNEWRLASAYFISPGRCIDSEEAS